MNTVHAIPDIIVGYICISPAHYSNPAGLNIIVIDLCIIIADDSIITGLDKVFLDNWCGFIPTDDTCPLCEINIIIFHYWLAIFATENPIIEIVFQRTVGNGRASPPGCYSAICILHFHVVHDTVYRFILKSYPLPVQGSRVICFGNELYGPEISSTSIQCTLY